MIDITYYETIASASKKELIKEAKRLMKEMDSLKIPYKRGQNYQHIKDKTGISNYKLEDMTGDTLYLLCVQFDTLIDKKKKGEL
ncbi:hypothetical protein [Massilimicrobiota timonensis]|uniref:hypothetical protein n=1 Tax=Massilimicrobiota timonensis TaxID=1776392 RepID=UPI001F5CDB48|nr:hypothetical protein [Massilimicrobiota timonensis]